MGNYFTTRGNSGNRVSLCLTHPLSKSEAGVKSIVCRMKLMMSLRTTLLCEFLRGPRSGPTWHWASIQMYKTTEKSIWFSIALHCFLSRGIFSTHHVALKGLCSCLISPFQLQGFWKQGQCFLCVFFLILFIILLFILGFPRCPGSRVRGTDTLKYQIHGSLSVHILCSVEASACCYGSWPLRVDVAAGAE